MAEIPLEQQMGTTREDLERFHDYAAARLTDAESDLSFDDLLSEWADIHDRQLINDAIRRGLADVEAGRYESADLAMEKIRIEFGFPGE
jgi:predicted transcriptional regulator